MATGFVINEREVAPVHADGDTATVRVTIGQQAGSERLEQSVLRFAAGRSLPRGPGEGRQEILYVASGSGRLRIDGAEHALEPDTGVFVVAGETYEIENPGPDELVLLSVTTPQRHAAAADRRVTVRFAEQPELRADENRTFRHLVNQDAGCADVTQFVGIVQPCRAPDHSHSYDEVGYIVEGEGVAHLDGRKIPLSAGSCFHLPPGLVHCIENDGARVMRILGVFHPSGDPASRSYDAARGANNEPPSAS